MSVITNSNDLDNMRYACKTAIRAIEEVAKHIKVGVTTKQLDKIAYDFIKQNNAKPAFLNYEGYKHTICASVNEEIVHGLPSDRVLKDGDIVTIDCGVYYKGFNSDVARTYPVGNVSDELLKLIKVTEESFYQGIKNLKAGTYVGDVSHTIQTYVEKHGYSVVRELIGHGVGRHLHETPDIPNFGIPNTGDKFVAGQTVAIEPMVNLGDKAVRFMPDGWTCIARDLKPSAHYENTVLITEDGVEILTI